MELWRLQLQYDPVPALLGAGDAALAYFTRRDLLNEPGTAVETLWHLAEPERIFRKQQANGSWPRSGANQHPAINDELIETWRNFRFLVEKYGVTRVHPGAERAAEFFFTCQSAAGDFRGMLANQYATYYTGAILSLLIQAGYAVDPRTEKCLEWLLSMRQDDGGWTIPILTRKLSGKELYRVTSEYADPIEPDRSQPFSHNWTGMALRAFAQHPTYRAGKAAQTAARLLVSRLFRKDAYPSYEAASYWVRFEYPYWWNQLISALDTVSMIGLTRADEKVAQGLCWLAANQQPDGLWKVTYARENARQTAKSRDQQLWITLAACRVFKRLYSEPAA
ncbi:MAG TPA: hypothetical protein VIO36_11875 [Anaerolineaceae bacterium]